MMKVQGLIKKILTCSIAMLFIAVILTSCVSRSDSETSVSKDVIDFSLPDLKGKTINLSEYRGKVVIVDFWATWCPPCRIEIPHFIDLYNTYQLEGLEIIGVTLQSGSSQEVAGKVRDFNINYTIVMGNNEVARRFGGVRAFPTTFVIDKEGKIYKKYIGYQSKEVFESDIKALF